MITLLISCRSEQKTENVLIERSKDTVKVNETFSAKLSVPNMRSTIPSFYILGKDEKFLLPYDDEKKFALFKGESGITGERIYMGMVEYIDFHGKERIDSFILKFYVKKVSEIP